MAKKAGTKKLGGKKAGGKRKPKATEPEYAFPTKVRCPRCKTTDNVRVSSEGPVQYRKCRRAHCRWSFKINGERV